MDETTDVGADQSHQQTHSTRHNNSQASEGRAKSAASSTSGESEDDDQETATSTSMGEKPRGDDPMKKKRKRKPPLVPWKKPKDMPRRPLSAYNLFFKEMREKMMSQMVAEGGEDASGAGGMKKSKKKSNKSVGIGFANLARTIASDWKDLDPVTRAPYEERAATEKNRYNKEMLVWRAKQKEEKERKQAEEDFEPGDSMYTGGSAEMVDAEYSTSGDIILPLRVSPASTSTTTNPRASMPIHHQMTSMDSPKKSRLHYQQFIEEGRLGMAGSQPHPHQLRIQDLNLNNSGRWSDVGTFEHHAARLIHQQQSQVLHSSMSRIEGIPVHHSSLGGRLLDDQHHRSLPGGFHMELPMNDEPPCFGGIVHADHHQLSDQMRTMEDQLLMMQQQQQLQQQQQQQQQQNHARRNTWSGEIEKQSQRIAIQQAQRRNADNSLVGGVGAAFPDSWFEVDPSPPPPPQPQESTQRSTSKLYPDHWFEVQQEESNVDHAHDHDEHIRYSPQGDLVGKLPSRGPSFNRGRPSAVVASLKDDLLGVIGTTKKMNEDPPQHGRPLQQSLEDVSMGGNSIGVNDANSMYATQQQQQQPRSNNNNNAIVESSLQTLGLQLDDETLDFLTKLRYDNNG